MTDFYDLLHVPREATTHEIRDAYWRKMRTQSSGLEPGDRARQLREAYETLSDPYRRARYDMGADGDGTAVEPVAAAITSVMLPPLLPQPEPEPVATEPVRRSRNPIDRMTARLPRPWRIAIDWIVTIAGAILIVLAIKQWVVNPYRIPSSSMEPTLHCARPGEGCEARLSDRVLANRFIYHFRSPRRGEIIVFNTPTARAEAACNASGTFVKRLIGLPGDTVRYERHVLTINGKVVKEPYVRPGRAGGREGTWKVPAGHYFFMGDNRLQSCDSRAWGSVTRSAIIGEVFMTYWPPSRLSLHAIVPWLSLVFRR